MPNSISVGGFSASPVWLDELSRIQRRCRPDATFSGWPLRLSDSAPIHPSVEDLATYEAAHGIGPVLPSELPGPIAQPVDLAEVWAWLVSGKARVLESSYSPKRCSLLLEATSHEKVLPALGPTKAAMLARVLRGEAQKVVAQDLGLAVSTVATVCSTGLRTMGTPNRPSRAPLLLMLAAHALVGTGCASARAARVASATRNLQMITADCPGTEVSATLTLAERHVVELMLEGRCHEEMGVARGTSSRTIANQVGGIYRKLRVSGRAALVAALVAG